MLQLSILVILSAILALPTMASEKADTITADSTSHRGAAGSGTTDSPLDRVLPRSPQAAAIARYGEWPVSMATGVPDITIPVYTIQLGGFELPVRLAYHASGIRAYDVASTVGLGWTLDAGGCISRSVCGAPDLTGADDTYYNMEATERLIAGVKANNGGTATLDDLLGNTASASTARQFGYDCLSDRYTYNFCGQTGVFRRSADDGSYIPLDYSRMLIEAEGEDCQGGRSAFRIVSTDGIEYTFAQQEQTGVASDENTTDVTAWYLTRVSTPWGDITIDYRMATAYRLTTVTETATTGYFGEYVHTEDGNWDYNQFKDQTLYNCHATRLLFRSPVPTRITWGGGNAVVFSYADDREDIWPTRLTAITVVNHEGDTVRTATPDNTLYWGKKDAKRMLLRGLSLSGEGRYSFEYDTTASLPPYLTFEKTNETTLGPTWAVTDFWGYYTGQTGRSLIPQQAYRQVLSRYTPTASWSGDDKLPLQMLSDRTPVEQYTRLGSLTAITYPTGGTTHFETEQNDLGTGGLRISSITTRDRDGSLLLQKSYTYNAAVATADDPMQATCYTSWHISDKLPYGGLDQIRCDMTCTGSPESPVNAAPPVIYTSVTETDAVGNSTESRFKVFPDPMSLQGLTRDGEHPGLTPAYVNDYGGFRPVLVERTVRDTASQVLLHEEYDYEQVEAKTFSTGTKLLWLLRQATTQSRWLTSQVGQGTLSVNASTLRCAELTAHATVLHLMSKTVTDGPTGVAATTRYTYDPLLRTQQPKSTATANSDGRLYTTLHTYAFEQDDTTCRRMVEEGNRYDTRTVTRTYCDSTLLTTERTAYRLVQPGGFYLPATVSRSRLSGEEREKWRFDAYGPAGNPLRLITDQCDTTDIAWDATGTMPTAYSLNGRQKAAYTWKPLVGITSLTTENGHTTHYAYDREGRLATIADRHGTRQTFGYDCIRRADGTEGVGNIVETVSHLSASGNSRNTTIGYHDGIGRMYLMATNGKNTEGNYIYTLTEFDRQGCPSVAWLPVKGTTSAAELHTDSIAWLSNHTYGDRHAYTTLHHNALGRTTFSQTAGDAWYAAAKGKATEYVTNGNRDVRRYDAPLTENSLLKCGYYEPGTLLGTKTTDEDGHTLTVYSDKLGRKVLERRGKDNDTYFVYDDLGQLRFVLSPEYQKAGYKEKYAYEYRYDQYGHLAKKILPQCEPTQFWHDRAGRTVFSQDGLLRAKGRYRFHLYDPQGRLALEGTCASCNRSLKGALAHPTATYGSGAGIAGSGYTLNCDLQLADVRLETVNYYDTYDFEHGHHQADFAPLGTAANGTDATGLLTATITATSDGLHLYATYAYDDLGLLIHTATTTLGGATDHTHTSRTFTGKAAQTTHRVLMNGKELLADEQCATYAPFCDKLRKVTLSVAANGRKKETHQIALITYTPLGQLNDLNHSWEVGGVHYIYNLHGQLHYSSSKHFSEDLYYAKPPVGTPCYNGDISFIKWEDEDDDKALPQKRFRSYRFVYDDLDRLTEATYGVGCECPYEEYTTNANRYNERVLEYTANGAIKRLQRRGLKQNGEYGKIDNLHIKLDGNRPVKVVDDAKPLSYDGAFDFHDDDNSQDVEYTYNAVGALTADRNRGITSIEYDDRGNTRRIHFANGSTTEYVYAASGEKLRTIHGTTATLQADTTDYVGTLILKNGQPALCLFDGGYASFETPDSTALHYFTYDHLGNIRNVLNADGKPEQTINYYPFGTPYSERDGGGRNADFQPYKLSGKELDTNSCLRTYDFGARQYNPLLAVWDRPDRLAEKYPHLSPYAYCGNSPLMAIDVNGDSLSLFNLSANDQNNGTNYAQNVIADLQFITGLNLSVSEGGMITYAKDRGGNPTIGPSGSETARNFLMNILDATEIVNVYQLYSQNKNSYGSYTKHGENNIGLYPQQIEGFIRGSVGIDNRTLGWGMTLIHELHHTGVGGAWSDSLIPYQTGDVVDKVNHIRSELNEQDENFGYRTQYVTITHDEYNIIPLTKPAAAFLSGGIIPSGGYIIFK